eukprot:761346-Amphidinium_carterae.1
MGFLGADAVAAKLEDHSSGIFCASVVGRLELTGHEPFAATTGCTDARHLERCRGSTPHRPHVDAGR